VRHRLPGLVLVDEPQRGASRARNRGLATATGELVAFVDGDVRPDPEWLAAMVSSLLTPIAAAVPGALAAERLPDCVTGLILPAALDHPSQAWLEEWGGYAKGFRPRAFDLDGNRPEEAPLFPFAIAICGSGASLAMRRRAALELGGFDVALGGGVPAASGEDLALLLDVVAAGGVVAYEPRAIAWHEHPVTEAQFRAILRAYGIGLTAYVARHVLRRPRDLLRLAATAPAALAYFLRPRSERNRRRSAGFPRGITRLELEGMLIGPFAYAAGRVLAARSRAPSRRVARS